jgi:hypothetical protein
MTASDPTPSPNTLEELRRLAYSQPKSGREAMAKASALRTLERINRRPRRGRPAAEIPPCPPKWHPNPGTEWEELDRAHFERNPHLRERWWQAVWLEGHSSTRP